LRGQIGAIENKVAIVTGGRWRIGGAIVQRFGARGSKLAVAEHYAERPGERGEPWAAQRADGMPIAADVTDKKIRRWDGQSGHSIDGVASIS